LRAHKLGGHNLNLLNTHRVLRGNCGDGSGGVSAKSRAGLDVSLNTSTARRVRASDYEDTGGGWVGHVKNFSYFFPDLIGGPPLLKSGG
jgi:hypothetical protein